MPGVALAPHGQPVHGWKQSPLLTPGETSPSARKQKSQENMTRWGGIVGGEAEPGSDDAS